MPRDYAPTEVAERPEVAATRAIEKRAQQDRTNGETAYQTILDSKEGRPGPVIMIGGHSWDLKTEDGRTTRPFQNHADYLTAFQQMTAFYRQEAQSYPDKISLQELHRSKGGEVLCHTETRRPVLARELSAEQAGPLLSDMPHEDRKASYDARQIERCKESLRGFARAALRSGDVKILHAVHQELAEPIDAKTAAEAVRKIDLTIKQIDGAPLTVHERVKTERRAAKAELEHWRSIFQKFAESKT